MWTYSFGNIPERVDSGSSYRLLMRLEQLEQFETNPHPLPGRHVLRTTIGDPSDQVDAILLHLLVPILQDRRQTGEKVLDWRGHFRHADHVHDGLQRT